MKNQSKKNINNDYFMNYKEISNKNNKLTQEAIKRANLKIEKLDKSLKKK